MRISSFSRELRPLIAYSFLAVLAASMAACTDDRAGDNDSVSFTGILDTDFGSNGQVLIEDGRTQISAVTLDTKNNIIVAGLRNNNLALWRFTDNGTPDTNFGHDYNHDGLRDGYILSDIDDLCVGFDVIVTPNEKILVGGFSQNFTDQSNGHMVLWSFTSVGEIDDDFGQDYNEDGVADGYTLHQGAFTDINIDSKHALGRTIFYQDNAVYIAGKTHADKVNYLTVWKFTLHGQLDSSFGSTGEGFASHSLPSSSTLGAFDIAIAHDSDLLILGTEYPGQAYVLRLDPAGEVDTSFGKDYDRDGTADGYIYAIQSYTGNALAIDGDDRIYITGSLRDEEVSMGIWRFTPQGKPDLTYGGDVNKDGNHDSYTRYAAGEGRSLLFDANNNILIGGRTDSGMTLWRQKPDGSVDKSFGDDLDGDGLRDGYVVHGNESITFGEALGIVIDSSNRVLLVGYYYPPGLTTQAVIARYIN